MAGYVTSGKVLHAGLALFVGLAIAYMELIYVVPYIVFILMISLGKDIQNFVTIDTLYQMKKGGKSSYQLNRKDSNQTVVVEEHYKEAQEKELIYLDELRTNILETIKIKVWGYGIILITLSLIAFFAFGGIDYLSEMNWSGSNFINANNK